MLESHSIRLHASIPNKPSAQPSRPVVQFGLTTQFESFVPVWAYDEPKQKKKKVKSSKRSSKSASGASEGEEGKGQSSATDLPSTAGLSQRQTHTHGATVEEIDDDEA
jgi:hypothetical protein